MLNRDTASLVQALTGLLQISVEIFSVCLHWYRAQAQPHIISYCSGTVGTGSCLYAHIYIM